MRVCRMRTGYSYHRFAADRRRLRALVRDRNAPQKQRLARRNRPAQRRRVPARWRSCGGPASPRPASGAGRSASPRKAWTGLLRDKTRPSRIPPLGPEVPSGWWR